MFDIFIALALAVLTLLLVRTVLRGRTGRARPPQRTNTLDQTSAPADRFSGVAIQGSSVAQGSMPSRRRTSISTSGISSTGQSRPTRWS